MNPEPFHAGMTIGNFLIRPARGEDAEGILHLLSAIAEADNSLSTSTPEEIENLFSDPRSDPQRDSLIAFNDRGEVIGGAWVFLNPRVGDNLHAELWCEVHPQYRESMPEMGEFLLTWAIQRGSQRLYEAPGELIRLLMTICWEDHHSQAALLEANGFFPLRYFVKMRRDLNQPIAIQPLPSPLTLSTYRAELNESLREAFNDIFQDDWTFHYASPQDWQTLYVGRSDFLPDMTFLALDGKSIVGFSLNHLHRATNGQHEGYITYIGTRREWRGKGVASALLSASLQAFKEADIPFAGLGVDTNNPNEALRLYLKMGFVPLRRLVHFAREA